MRLLLDEHFPGTIAVELRRHGVDAVAIATDRPELQGRDDDAVLRAATSEGRVTVTNNVRDFAPLVEDFALRGETHIGVLFTDDETFPRSSAGIGLLVRALALFVEGKRADDLQDSCMYLPRPSGS